MSTKRKADADNEAAEALKRAKRFAEEAEAEAEGEEGEEEEHDLGEEVSLVIL